MSIWFALAASAMGFGWLMADSPAGIALVVAGSVAAGVLVARYRTPQALTYFALATAAGWWVVFVTYPIGFGVPLTALFIARQWKERLKRREAVDASDAGRSL